MEAYEAICPSGLVYMRMIYPYEAIYSSGLVYMMMIYQWIPQCDDLQFIRKEESPGAMSRKRHEPNLKCRSFPGFHYILVGERKSMLVFVILWCYYERMANHGAILVWSSVLAGAQLRRDVIWYY